MPDTVSVALAELAGEMREGLLALAVGTGLEVMAAIMESGVWSRRRGVTNTQLAGEMMLTGQPRRPVVEQRSGPPGGQADDTAPSAAITTVP